MPLQRFVAYPEFRGGRKHHIEMSRRRETSLNALEKLLRKPQELRIENNLWPVLSVNPIQQENGQIAMGTKNNPNSPGTVVEKYGHVQEAVGYGSFGIVRVSRKKTKTWPGEELYAVKELCRRPLEEDKTYTKRMVAEFSVSRELHHSHVIHTFDLLKDARDTNYVVVEFCGGGTLHSLMLSAAKLGGQEADCFFKQLMLGVQYIHEMGVAPRDLKLENLLLTYHGKLKIADFGVSECFRLAWEDDNHLMSGPCGSSLYIAPEEYRGEKYDGRAADIWACGIIYVFMRTSSFHWRIAKEDKDESYARYLENAVSRKASAQSSLCIKKAAEVFFIASWIRMLPAELPHYK